MKPRLFEVRTIAKGFLAVMAKPTAGEWIEEEFSGIAKTGIRQLVSLLESDEAFALGLGNEQQYCERNNIRFIHWPVPDRHVPDSISGFAKLTAQLHKEIASGESTVVHCRAGIGRSGLLTAGILLHDGLDAKEAFAVVSAARRLQVPDTEEQREWLIRNQRLITS